MNKKTLKALKGSIQKWEKIVAGDGIDEGINNCPLCKEFYEDDCIGCPVDHNVCSSTPYPEWCIHQEKHHNSYRAECSTCKTIAIKELNFLKSLLPHE